MELTQQDTDIPYFYPATKRGLPLKRTEIDDRELFARIASGDEAAFKDLFVQCVPQLNAFLTRLTHGEAETNELIQEIFIRIWLSRHLLPEIEQPRAWINGIASNVSFSWIRSRIRMRTLIGKVASQQVQESLLHVNSLDKRISLYDLQNLVAAAISHLSPRRRKIYQLSREKSMTIPEIANELKLSPSTVKNTLVTALGEIRKFLEKSGYELLLFLLAWIKSS